MIGSILVKVAFIACLASVASYLQHRRRPSPNLLFYARALYLAHAGHEALIMGLDLLFLSGESASSEPMDLSPSHPAPVQPASVPLILPIL